MIRPAAALAVLLAVPAFAQDGLTVFDWSGYEDPGFHAPYIAQHGGVPDFSYFGDEEEAFQKLRAGFRADLAHPCSQSVPRWREAGLIEPIDPARIAAWGTLIPQFRDMPGFVHEGQHYIVPMEWGNTLLSYRTDIVPPEDVKSLRILADPKYQGRVSIGDNVDDAYALASLVIGLKDWTQMTDAQFADASAFLREVHKNVRLYWTDNAEIASVMGSGEVALAWTWTETPTAMAAEGLPVAATRDTVEGISSWVCGYVLLKDGPGSRDRAYDFINSWLSAETAQHLVTAWGYGHSNLAALATVDRSVLDASGYGVVDKFPQGTLFQTPVPPALKEKMVAEFEKIKAGF